MQNKKFRWFLFKISKKEIVLFEKFKTPRMDTTNTTTSSNSNNNNNDDDGNGRLREFPLRHRRSISQLIANMGKYKCKC